jgi:hypothetical protein
VSTTLFPKKRHIMVWTTSTNGTNEDEVGPMDFYPRGCYWGSRQYTDTDWNTDNQHSLFIIDYAWRYWNEGATWNGRDHRIQIQYSLFNEMKQTQYENLGYDELTAINATKKVPCMWV